MYGSSGTPTWTTTTRPSGRVADCSTVRPRSDTAPQSTVRASRDAALVQAERERVVHFRPRTILVVIGILIAVAAALEILWISRHGVAWFLLAMSLALALTPAVDRLERRLSGRRGLATGIVFLGAIAAIAGIGALFIP